MSIRYLYWIGLELMLKRKDVFLFVGKSSFGLLILLETIFYGRLGMVHMLDLAWIHGLAISGDTFDHPV